MYSTRFCPYCVRARGLLDSKRVSYTDIAVDGAARAATRNDRAKWSLYGAADLDRRASCGRV